MYLQNNIKFLLQNNLLNIIAMIFKQLIRQFHAGQRLLAAEKSGLATLRKKTGYTFANCKKALELHNNDLAKVKHFD